MGLAIGLSLADASKFIFGGSGIMHDQEQIPNAGKMLKNNYTGCISSKFKSPFRVYPKIFKI